MGAGALAAGLLVLSGAQAVSANLVWCDDPPIRVVTPGGTTLMVNNMIYLSPADIGSASLVTHDATAARNPSGGTRVTVHVHVPAAMPHGATVRSSINRFNVTAIGATPTGPSEVTLYLDVPIT
jgi:hypothetical protein